MLRVKYSLKTMTPTMGTCSVLTILRRQSICSSVRHRTSSRRHFGLQIVQTSTQSIIKYMGCASAASLQQIQTVDELRQRIIEELEHLDQRVIDNAVKQWRQRLRSCAVAKGLPTVSATHKKNKDFEGTERQFVIC